MHVQEITITGPIKNKGSNQVSYNVDLNGRPFGQIWTFKAKGEKHGFHVTNCGGSRYAHCDTYAAAEAEIRSWM